MRMSSIEQYCTAPAWLSTTLFRYEVSVSCDIKCLVSAVQCVCDKFGRCLIEYPSDCICHQLFIILFSLLS